MPITKELQKPTPRVAARKLSAISAVPRAKTKLRVAAYCRVSTDYAEQEGSMEAQQAHMEAVILANTDWEYAGVFTESGVSGTRSETRPELQRLLESCEKGRIDLILTKSISRFARNAEDCLQMVRRLNALGVGIVFEKEALDTRTMESELFLSILASLAAEESLSLSKNVAWGYRKRFEKGQYKYSRPPYGYDAVEGMLVVNCAEARVVEEIFGLVLEGQGFEAIAKLLNARGVSTKTGKRWQQGTVRKIVGNITYTGAALFQKYYRDEKYRERVNRGVLDQYWVEKHHEAIIPPEVFQAAAEVIEERREHYGTPTLEEDEAAARRRTRRGPMSGKVYCRACGSVMHRYVRRGSSGRREPVWVCSGRRKGKCDAPQIGEAELREQCREMLDRMASGDEASFETYLAEIEAGADGQRRAELVERLEKNKYEQERLAALGEGASQASLFAETRAGLQREEEEILKGLARESRDGALNQAKALRRFLVESVGMNCLDEAFAQHIQSVIVDNVGSPGSLWVEIEFRCGYRLQQAVMDSSR